MDLLERLRDHRPRVLDLLEHEPTRELVAAVDIVRTDELGRNVVAVPAGQVPPHWVQLTKQERDTLVEPAPPTPDGHMHPGPFGFSPEGVKVGFTIEQGWTE